MKRLFSKVKIEIAYYRALITHPNTPRLSRWLLVIAIAYFLSPIDLIPDGIPILGQLDDLLIVPGLIYTALALIPRSVKQECRETVANKAAAPLRTDTPLTNTEPHQTGHPDRPKSFRDYVFTLFLRARRTRAKRAVR